MAKLLNANALTHTRGFRKAVPGSVAFSKTGNFAVSTATRITVEVNGGALDIPASTVVIMPGSPVTGTDYAIWAKPNGTLEATTWKVHARYNNHARGRPVSPS